MNDVAFSCSRRFELTAISVYIYNMAVKRGIGSMDRRAYSDRQSPDKIWFLCRERGESRAQSFFMGLDDRTFAATVQLFDRTEIHGPPHNKEKFRHLKGDVYEFKVHRAQAVRYLAFAADDGWIVAFARQKNRKHGLRDMIAETQRLHDEYEGASS